MPYETLQRTIGAILCTACVVRPRDPGLAPEELRAIAVELGVGPGEYDDDIGRVVEGPHVRMREVDTCIVTGTHAWGSLSEGLFAAPDEVRPLRLFARLAEVFDDLDRLHGRDYPKSEALLLDRLAGFSKESFDLAVGLLIAWRALAPHRDGLVRKSGWMRSVAMPNQQDPLVAHIQRLRPHVERAFERRGSRPVSMSTPLERFTLLARTQGWDQFASWWVLTQAEFRVLSDVHTPTSVCVLAGAMLEAALIAVAPAAIASGQWNRKFLREHPPERWNLGELIDQAEAARTLTPAEAGLARDLANLRNRIHAGRFAPIGKLGPLAPQYANVHEAQLARMNLDRLLDRVLSWPPVANLV